MNGQRKRGVIICRCNSVSRETIEDAIRGGAKTLNEIFDQTAAGVGSCGGSCRRKLRPMLQSYLTSGAFPERVIEDARPILADLDDVPTDSKTASESKGDEED